MRKVLFLLLAAGALLVAVGLVALAHAQAGGTQPVVTTLSGEHYRLVSLDAGGNILAGGGGYMLWGPAAPELQGSGCCCIYLPCVLRSSP